MLWDLLQIRCDWHPNYLYDLQGDPAILEILHPRWKHYVDWRVNFHDCVRW